MLDAGAKGYLLKNASGEMLHEAILHALANGQTICEEARQALADPVRSTNRIHMLTPRQREILELVYDGYTDQAIAAHLGLSYHTVNHHMGNILRKLEVTSRSQAVAQLQVAKLS
jgi:NarL family two-component system response regulator LiaR